MPGGGGVDQERRCVKIFEVLQLFWSGLHVAGLAQASCCMIYVVISKYTPVFSTLFDMRNCGKATWFIDFRNTRRIDASYEEK